MKFKEFLNEAPALDNFSRAEIKSMVDTYITAMRFDHTVVGKIKGKEVIKYSKRDANKLRYAILDHDNKKVLFMSGISLYGSPQQSLIWKDEKSNITSSDLRKIFVDIILKEHKIIRSDDLQSEGGQKFWYALCKQYLSSDKYEVGVIMKGKGTPFTKDNFEEKFENAYEEENSFSQIYMRIK